MQLIIRRLLALRAPRALFAILLFGVACPAVGHAQTFSPFSDFQSMTLADMDSLRIKFTFGGMQDRPVGSVTLAVAGVNAPVALFTPYRRTGFEYSNEDLGLVTTAASRQELKAIIDDVGTLSQIASGSYDTNGTMSFVLLSTAGGTTKAFESIVNETDGRLLFGQVLSALVNNQVATNRVRRIGCRAVMLPTTAPSNLQGQAVVHFSGVRADRSAKSVFVGEARVTNTSGSTIAPPLLLVVSRTTGNAVLMGEDGLTCNIEPRGAWFLKVDVGIGLAPGASVKKSLRFTNPSLEKFDVTFRAFAGAGTP